ncbi:PREDICTED: zinc finger protein 501-like [Dinoponera quadriceps]|uniref:Zinc finger protein 501-like n=1 Tax=Dinoponera quadriceps TaxID=609295 RepID=A0A6P3YG91_DINQU|nr:PREDICTED: zinc finger protein 501-like [Dinoponera quadriceps]
MNFSEEQIVDLSSVQVTTPLLEMAIQAGSNVNSFPECNSGGNMQSQETPVMSAITGQKMDAQTQFEQQLQCNTANIMTEPSKWCSDPLLSQMLQHLVRHKGPQIREKEEERKVEHLQSNILNIPSVPIFRNAQSQNSSSLANVDSMLVVPVDLNVHLENEQENESNPQPVIKVEQQVQTDPPKIEKKWKSFRAKIGEIKITVNPDGSKYYYCRECNSYCSNKANVDKHIQAHIQERKYECKECGALLKRKEHLDQHMRGHSDERPYKCSLCEKAFKRNEHLTRHSVIHSGDKNFSCTVCHKAFSRKDHLNKHTQTHSGMRKNKMKNSIYYMDQKDSFDKSADVATIPKQEVKPVLTDSMPKQENILSQISESVFLQNLQNIVKDPAILHTLTSLRVQMPREGGVLQQEDVSTDDILSDNVRYVMPS